MYVVCPTTDAATLKECHLYRIPRGCTMSHGSCKDLRILNVSGQCSSAIWCWTGCFVATKLRFVNALVCMCPAVSTAFICKLTTVLAGKMKPLLASVCLSVCLLSSYLLNWLIFGLQFYVISQPDFIHFCSHGLDIMTRINEHIYIKISIQYMLITSFKNTH